MKAELEKYKKNAEEDYIHTPISVLRYISELESLSTKEEGKDAKEKFYDKRFEEGKAMFELGKEEWISVEIEPDLGPGKMEGNIYIQPYTVKNLYVLMAILYL